MGQAARWVFGLSWQAGVLIAAVMLLRWVMGRRLTPGWRCVLWTLVGVRLLTPGFVHLPDLNHWGTESTPTAAAVSKDSGMTVTVVKFWGGLAQTEITETKTHAWETRATNWGEVLAWGWAGGVVVVVGRLVIVNVRLGRRVRGMNRVGDAGVMRLVKECAEEMGVRREVKVVETGEVRSPAVWGLWRPVVMLPAGSKLAGEDLRLVLLHEMAHVRRWDVAAEWGVGLLKGMHWFNPLVWLAAGAYHADRELACDAAVLRQVGPEREGEYGACLLRVVEAVAGMRPEPAAVGMFGGRRNIRRRIEMIAGYQARRPAAWVMMGVFIAMAGAAAIGMRPASGPVDAEAEAKAQAEMDKHNDLDRATITRVYDIRDLLIDIPDFYGPRFSLGHSSDAATQPATQPVRRTREELVNELLQLIQNTIAPDSWRANGGTTGSMRELKGNLIVTQTRENHAALEQVLEQLRQSRAVQITIATRYVFVDQATMDQLGMDWLTGPAKNEGKGVFVTDEQMNQFLRSIQTGKESTTITAPRLTLFNSQRAYAMVGVQSEYVKDFTLIRTREGETRYESKMGTVFKGLVLDVQGTVSADRKFVTVTLQSTMSDLKGMKSKPFAGGVEGMKVETPDVVERTTKMTAKIPDNTTLMLTAMTPEAAEGTGTRPKGQTFIFIKPTILVQQETKAKKATPPPSLKN